MFNRVAGCFFCLCIHLYVVENGIAEAANILYLAAIPSPSHSIWNAALSNALAARGHNVTIVSCDVDPKAPPNVHYIHVEGVYDYMYKERGVDLVACAYASTLDAIDVLSAFTNEACLGVRRAKGLNVLLNYPNDFKFDLVLYDYTLGPCILGFLHKFHYPPMVGVTAYNNPPFTIDIIGGHNYWSYVPHFAAMMDSQMTFYERAVNYGMNAWDRYRREYLQKPLINGISEEIFGADYPRASDLEAYVQLCLVNTHPAIDFPEPLPPNVIPVGGLQIVEPKPLPKDIDEFMRQGKSGSVLFSFGTNVKSKDLGLDRQLSILEAFKQLPQYNFLWKFEEDVFPVALPSNVMIRKWLCQNDVLAHSNVKAFVTHGGTLSTFEAVYHGVPTISVPFIVDQFRNTHKSVKWGTSVHLPLPSLTADALKSKLLTVLTDPAYARNAAIRSHRFRDQPERPMDRAIWWVEYVLRNQNVTHMQSPVLHLGFVRANSLDLYATVLIALLIAVALVGYSAWWLVRTLHGLSCCNVKLKTN